MGPLRAIVFLLVCCLSLLLTSPIALAATNPTPEQAALYQQLEGLFQQAMQAISAKPLAPSDLETTMVEQAGTAMSRASERIRSFLEGTWRAYQGLVDAHRADPFAVRNP